jgi:2-polyprenyl-6-methoxyphenol hydroxylase-like FAD-dependent oxidoreductase
MTDPEDADAPVAPELPLEDPASPEVAAEKPVTPEPAAPEPETIETPEPAPQEPATKPRVRVRRASPKAADKPLQPDVANDTQILIAGAGPTGLVLALWLTRLGVPVRIFDKALEPGTTSRALAVQARILELYREAGIAQEVIDRGTTMKAVNLWVAGRKVAHVDLDKVGRGISPFANLTIFPQDEHEKLLIAHLAKLGVQVERGLELVDFTDDGVRVTATLKRENGDLQLVTASYLAGCDGARSVVRHKLAIGFEGGDYAQLFYVADAEISGPVGDGELHACLDEAEFLAVFPMKGAGHARLIGAIDPAAVNRGGDITWEDVSPRIYERMQITVDKINWFSTYHVHHRVADRFRRGRAFLLGDAAHIHSPVGGQGMNTGIGDAINLAWKFSEVLQRRATDSLLDTYEAERIGFARKLVNTTDQVFKVVSSEGAAAEYARIDVLPRLLPVMFNLGPVRRFLFRTVSQTGVNYHGSRLSGGGAGYVRGGDRLPWVQPKRGEDDNYTPLDGLDWQVHVYGEPKPELSDACGRLRLALHAFPWRAQMREAGLMKDAAYLLRPDGYVALADPHASPGNLARYLDSRGLAL